MLFTARVSHWPAIYSAFPPLARNTKCGADYSRFFAGG